MARLKNILWFVLGLFVSFFLDGQISFLLSSLSGYRWVFTSHLLIILVMVSSHFLKNWALYPIFFLVGIVHDSYYFHTIGIACFLYPILVFLASKHKGLMERFFLRLLLFLVLITLFDLSAYSLGYAYQMTKMSLQQIILVNLAPSLLLNSLLLLGMQWLFTGLED